MTQRKVGALVDVHELQELEIPRIQISGNFVTPERSATFALQGPKGTTGQRADLENRGKNLPCLIRFCYSIVHELEGKFHQTSTFRTIRNLTPGFQFLAFGYCSGHFGLGLSRFPSRVAVQTEKRPRAKK